MKLTCLSEGGGFHFPPCYIINICGFRILLDCPLDLSALTIFSPIPVASCTMFYEESADSAAEKYLDLESPVQKRQKINRPLCAKNLIHAEPFYRSVESIHLWDLYFINIVLISSPMGMLGLPFLTRTKDFSAKIYATEAATRLGQLMMEELVAMHMELRQFYGPELFGFPKWAKLEELELLPSALSEIASGKDGSNIHSWMPLYRKMEFALKIQQMLELRLTVQAATFSIDRT